MMTPATSPATRAPQPPSQPRTLGSIGSHGTTLASVPEVAVDACSAEIGCSSGSADFAGCDGSAGGEEVHATLDATHAVKSAAMINGRRTSSAVVCVAP